MTAKEAIASIKTLLKAKFSDGSASDKFEAGKLSDGTEIEYSKLEAGGDITVTDSTGAKVPAPVGELELEDGRIIVITEAGKIAEVKDAAAPAEPEPTQQAAQQMADEPAPAGGGVDWKPTIDSLKRDLAYQAERIATLQNAMATFRAATGETMQAFAAFLEALGEEGVDDTKKPKQSVFAEQKKKDKEAAKAKAKAGFEAFSQLIKNSKK